MGGDLNGTLSFRAPITGEQISPMRNDAAIGRGGKGLERLAAD